MEPSRSWRRAILHVDMDAFFAAVEVLDNPSLAGKPVIVGGTPEGRGVVSTASYEARRFGVRSAMPAATAVRLCPQGIFLWPRMGRYAEISGRVFKALEEVSPLVEGLSIDEAFVDATGCCRGADPWRMEGGRFAIEDLAADVQARIETATGGLTASVGIAENKFLAKVASDLRKPRGRVVVPPGTGPRFLAPLPVERLWGVGPRTAEALHGIGLRRIGNVAETPEEKLQALLGADLASHLKRLSQGIDDRPVEAHLEARSVGRETTFAEFLSPSDRDGIEGVLFALADDVAFRLRADALWCRTVQLKVRDGKFRTCTRSRTLREPTQVVEDIYGAARALFWERIRLGRERVRLLGVTASNLIHEPLRQLELFDGRTAERERAESAARASDEIRRKLGDGAITRGRLLGRGRVRPR